MKTAPIADSTISARSFGTSISPLECNGNPVTSWVNFVICMHKSNQHMLKDQNQNDTFEKEFNYCVMLYEISMA